MAQQPSLGTPQLRPPSLDDKPAESAPAAAPLPAYAPSLSRTGSTPGFAPSLSAGKLKDPTEGMSLSPTPAPPKESFLVRNVPGLNMPAWQVMLGGVGILAVTVGVVSLFTGSSKPSPRRMLRGY